MYFIKKIVKILRNLIKKILFILKFPFCHLILANNNIEDVRIYLSEIKEQPSGTVEANNEIIGDKDLSIIVPAYNAEKYIEQCVMSVLLQRTKYSYELIIINDGSTDSTKKILSNIENQKNVKIINQENRGFSGARNRGLDSIRGKYLMFLDSDDYLLQDSIEKLMDIAIEKNADIVEGESYAFYNNFGISNKYIHKSGTRRVDAMKELSGYPWGKVYKSAIFQKIKFPEGYWFEDTILSMLVYCQYDNVWVTDTMVYAYRLNPKGITKTSQRNNKSIDSFWITEMLLNEQENEKLISFRTFEQFWSQIVTNYQRTRNLDENIQRAIFLLTIECYKKVYQNRGYFLESWKSKKLELAVKTNDWGMARHLMKYWYSI